MATIIFKTKNMIDSEERAKMWAEIKAMLEEGIIVLDGRYEYPPTIVDGNPKIVIKSKIKKPAPGEHFYYKDIEFVAIGEEQGGILAISAYALDEEMPFDKSGRNNWKTSTSRKWLNEEFIKNFDKSDLLPIVSDLTSDDGMKDYGTSEDYIAMLSCDLYRKYREFIPEYDEDTLTLTPWSCHPSCAYHVRSVSTSGVLNGNNADRRARRLNNG